MLPSERALAKKNEVLFEQYRQEALQQASAIVTERAKVRDIDMAIWDHFPFGLTSYVTLIFMKATRLASNVKAQDHLRLPEGQSPLPASFYLLAGEDPTTRQALEAKIDDELLDIVNYCAFAWAYRRLQEQQEQSPVCLKDTWMGDYPNLASCLCPKCKAEREAKKGE